MILNFEIFWLVKILGLLLWYILWPGFFLQFAFLKKISFLEKLGNAFAFGFAFFSLFAFIAYLIPLTLNTLNVMYLIINVIMLLYFFAYPLITKKKSTLLTVFKKYRWNTTHFIILIIAISSFLLSLFSGWYPRGDTAIHLQVIGNLLQHEFITHAYYSLPSNPIIPDHAYDTYYVFIALVAKISGLELSLLWHYFSPLFSFLIPLALFSFLRSMTNDRALIAFSLIAYFVIAALYPLLMYGTVFDAMVYPNRIYLWLILPIAFSMFFRYIKNKDFVYLLACVVIVLSMLLVHQSGFLFFNILLMGTFLLSLLYKGDIGFDRKKMISALSIILLFSVPLLMLKLLPNLNYIAESSSEIWHRHYQFFYLNEYLYAFSVKTYYKSGMLIAFALTLYFLYRLKINQKNRLFVLFSASGFISTFLIVFNPFIVPYLSKLISYVAIIRMLRMPMYFLLLGLILSLLYLYFKMKFSETVFARLKKTALLLFVLFASFIVGDKLLNSNPHHKLPQIFKLKSIIKENSTIISDPLTSTDIAEFLHIETPVIQFNGAADLVNIDQEKEDVNRLLNEDISFEEVESILMKYQADYLIVAHEYSSPLFPFENYKQMFKAVYNTNELCVYELVLKNRESEY